MTSEAIPLLLDTDIGGNTDGAVTREAER